MKILLNLFCPTQTFLMKKKAKQITNIPKPRKYKNRKKQERLTSAIIKEKNLKFLQILSYSQIFLFFISHSKIQGTNIFTAPTPNFAIKKKMQ